VRSGSSLIEALLALLLLQFGLLALVAASAVSARDLGTANRRARAQALARNRVELVRASPCGAAATGERRWPGGLRELWTVSAAGPLRMVVDSVELTLARGRQESYVLRGWTLCAE
jgi:Tfp pilus assembly protein PilV